MAFKKKIANAAGFEAEYHMLSHLSMNKLEGIVNVHFTGYKDASIRQSAPVDGRSGVSYNFQFPIADFANCADVVAKGYELVKALEDSAFVGAEDV